MITGPTGLLLATIFFQPITINTNNANNILLTENTYQFEKYINKNESYKYIRWQFNTNEYFGDAGDDPKIKVVIEKNTYIYTWADTPISDSPIEFSYDTKETNENTKNGIYFITTATTDAYTFTADKLYIVQSIWSQETPTTIIDGITDGIGLMSPISKQFLTGFSTLFWDSTANSGSGGLTTFGNFCLIFLGVSITFAVVKLALNLIRGKTGA